MILKKYIIRFIKLLYLKEIGITYILNAAESRGVNVGKEYFGDDYQYMGLKIEDKVTK